MKSTAILLVAASLFAAGSASAANSDRVSDVVFLKAARCDGLAKSAPGVLDVQAMDAFYKTASVGRLPFVMNQADAAQDRGKRDGRNASAKERVNAELSGVCAALLSDPSSVAKR